MYQDRAKPNPRGRGCSWNGTQEYTDGVLVLALHLTAARLFVPLPVCQSEPQQLLARAGGMERNGTSRAASPAFVGSGSILRSRPVFCLQQLYSALT